MDFSDHRNWVEISAAALRNNLRQIKSLSNAIICPCVKGNAYGHGLVESARVFVDAGADWLAVDALFEAEKLREAGISIPIYVMGSVLLENLERAVDLDLRLVAYNKESIEKLTDIGKPARVHIKLETGNNRQGVRPEELSDFILEIRSRENIEIEGICTHFANIEDTTDHSFAEKQLNIFKENTEGLDIPIKHCSNSAATMIFPKTHFDLVRPGIACYGMWPSNETYISYMKEIGNGMDLKPALSWKTRIAQIKTVPSGEYIGYGCSYKTSHETKLAVLPVGYYDGYDRGISGGYVLIKGKRAPIRGRICMNIMMVDVTDIPELGLEDEVILLGKSNEEEISAELFASWAGTINYEVTTRINERIPRIVTE